MKPKPECPLCLGLPRFRTWSLLAKHLCWNHDEHLIEGVRHAWLNGHHTEKGDEGCQCWCQWDKKPSWFATHAEFGEHLKAHGGVAHHLAEIQLGAIEVM